ncbi:hypothetical protein BVX97_01555 [bacterium E08(2017)]|nr:hypothetical protein BVX97_01555 [bacterium E08(2017)]
MIPVTDLHEKQKYVNAEMIEQVEMTPDTQILLTTGHRVYVKEAPEEVARLVIEYRREVLRPGYNADSEEGRS